MRNYNNVRMENITLGGDSMRYNFNDADDMIKLAIAVQSSVYWGFTFNDGEGDIQYKYFWNYCEQMRGEGYNSVEISDNNDVRFYR